MIASTVAASTGSAGNAARRRPLPTGAALTNPPEPSTTIRRKDVLSVKHTPETARVEPLPCRRSDPDLWFADQLADVAEAKARCLDCPIMAECREGALARRERHGVWGGELFHAGSIVQTIRRRGGPPEGARCAWEPCGRPLPGHLRADAELCSRSCREARARARMAARRAAERAA